MHILEKVSVCWAPADSAAHERQRKNEEHAVVVNMDQQAALWKRLDSMSGGIVPGELRRLFRLRRKYVHEIAVVLFLRQFVGDGILRSKL